MKAKKFDSDFDAGKDVSYVLDVSKARRPLQEQKRANVDFPVWMIDSLDKEARSTRRDAPIHYQNLAGRAS